MALATTDDVATRLGRSLTDPEAEMAEQTIEAVTAQIVDEVDRDLDWAEALDPVPGVLRAICVEKVITVGTNPDGVASESRSLGQFSNSRTFQRSGDVGIYLSDREKRLARQAVYGSLAASSYPRSVGDRLLDLREGRDVDELPPAD